jgi:hypothetical protein
MDAWLHPSAGFGMVRAHLQGESIDLDPVRRQA